MPTKDQIVRRLAAREGITLAAAADRLRVDPKLADSVRDAADPPEIDPPPAATVPLNPES